SIQAQIINLLMKLQKEIGLTIVFVSHDLRVIRHIADRVAVMYLGKIVEFADSESLFTTPKHPYTKALLSTIPVADPNAVRQPIVLKGDIPSPIHVSTGCPFHTRCW
ncbi:MAG TPA: peptide ABC transporter substrate-binding protein, partial [Dialister sp.]|nr:peptide ABC transporter substrate-binding protein [Dialister sp.]